MGSVHAVAVTLTRFDARQERVPDEAVDLGQTIRASVPVAVEQAQLDSLGDLAEEREVGARTVIGRTQRICGSWPDLHVAPPSQLEAHNAHGDRSLGISVTDATVAPGRTPSPTTGDTRSYGQKYRLTWWMSRPPEGRVCVPRQPQLWEDDGAGDTAVGETAGTGVAVGATPPGPRKRPAPW